MLFGQDNEHSTASSAQELDAKLLLTATVNRINRLHSISAEISIRLSLFDTEFTGSGQYEELASPRNARAVPNSPLTGNLFRLHLKMAPPESTPIEQRAEDNLLEIVCDQNSLWTYTLIEGEQKLTEINLTELGGFLSQLSETEQKILSEKGVTLPASMGNFPNLGGVAGLINALTATYDFQPKPEQAFFSSGTFAVWKLTGVLKPALKENIIKKQNTDDDLESQAPMPDQVEIYIGQKTPFPFRIAYSSFLDEEKKVTSPVMTIDFVRVYENVSSVTANHFIYAPKINSQRITKEYLKKIIPVIEF